jgi:hypothetical protein
MRMGVRVMTYRFTDACGVKAERTISTG